VNNPRRNWSKSYSRAWSLAGLLSLSVSVGVPAGMLAPASWVLRDSAGGLIPAAVDNDISTGALVQSSQSVVRCVIDLGAVHTVHRVFFTPTAAPQDPANADAPLTPASVVNLRVHVGDQPAPAYPPVASGEYRSLTGREIRVTASLRFPPAAGRFLVLELERGSLSNRWNLGEVEVYGWTGDQRALRQDAVVLEANAPAPLRLAADELSYYLGELAGYPLPVVAPGEAALYTGSLFRVANLKPLAPDYATMTNNQALGLFPTTPVNVERNGREITFRAWPYRNVLWSVWEFLDRQGVKWVYPDAHGDFVPAGRGIDLEVAPFQYTPSTDFIYANFGVEYLRADPDAFLHFWRNRWSHTWGDHQRATFDGTEVPPRPFPAYVPQADHVEGFDGYPHNFKNVIPDRLLEQHADWCGMLTNAFWAQWVGAEVLNRRLPPSQNWTTFDLTNPDARQFIIDKAIACWPDHARRNGNLYWLLPEDAYLFSEDTESVRRRGPLVGDPVPFSIFYPHSVSGDYYDFIRHIAEGVRTALPEARVGALAYANTHLPPAGATPFPSNVLVDICTYGARNLPLDAPENAVMRERLEQWSERVADLRHYDYDLIHSEHGALPMPVPLVSAMADRARFFHAHHMLAGGTQADLDTLRFNPWNYYAYPRFYWDVTREAAAVLREFFTGYYLESAAPMLDYYNTLERFLIANHVTLQGRGYDYGLVVGAYPVNVLKKMNQHLLRAESRAAYWVTRQRVRTAREGFNWILAQRGMTMAQISSVDSFARAGPGRTVTLDLRTARIQTAGQDVGDAWFLFSWAQVGDYVYFETPGRYQINIKAGIGYPDPEPHRREMLVHIGSMEYGPFLIDHASIDTYTLVVEVPAGVLEVAVEDLNNDGPFKVSTITIQDAPAAPAPAEAGGVVHLYDFAADGNPAQRIDSDWDGTPDLHELLAGTDELDPESSFIARTLTPTPAGLRVAWPSVEGKRYALYRAASLHGDFERVADDLAATAPENEFVDADPPAAGAFYRITAY
jgi:hypothetical protein